MPIQTLTAKTVVANTWTQLGGSYPSVPGTLVASCGGSLYIGPTNADSSTWTFSSAASMPVSVYVADISAVYIKSDATQIFLSYYPATENHPAVR